MNRHTYEHIWSALPYSGFDAQELLNRKLQWEATARELCEHITQKESIGLIAPTGTGKTVIAGLVIFGLKLKTLFCTPQRYLCSQHANLFAHIAGINITTLPVITGEIPREKRTWSSDAKVIFATPNVTYLDVMRNTLDLNCFDLVIFDEVHHATSSHMPYYTPLADLIHDLGIPLLGLSASPGETKEQICTVQEHCHITQWVYAQHIATPPRKENVVRVPCTPELIHITKNLTHMMGDILKELYTLGIPLPHITNHLQRKDITALERHIAHMPLSHARFHAFSLKAAYEKLNHAHKTVLTEGYATFLEYCAHLEHDYVRRKEDKGKDSAMLPKNTKAAQWILSNSLFQEAYNIALHPKTPHPKEVECIKLITQLARIHATIILFVWQKNTARALLSVLQDAGVRATTVFGGTEKNIARQIQIFEDLRQKKLDVVIATSVIEEGISVPEVDWVVSYDVPRSGIARIQRIGRTARIHKGNLLFILLDHSIDTAQYYVTKQRAQTTERLIAEYAKEKKSHMFFPSSSYQYALSL